MYLINYLNFLKKVGEKLSAKTLNGSGGVYIFLTTENS